MFHLRKHIDVKMILLHFAFRAPSLGVSDLRPPTKSSRQLRFNRFSEFSAITDFFNIKVCGEGFFSFP